MLSDIYLCGSSFRILKNRESAACSRQRKLQYMIDLEHRINVLENENAAIFEKIKLLEVKHITLATMSLSCQKVSIRSLLNLYYSNVHAE